MIDEELLQELLAKASSLYNDGDYNGAIEAWNEVLQADPDNTKAREGIQMSHLLIGDLVPDAEDGGSAEPADGGEPANVALTPQEVETRLGEGIARVKDLMAERKFPEALEGARSLVPIDPASEEVQKLIEEAQQSFESAPFIEEHLTLARELMAQGRPDEAEVECRKVFTLDRSNPAAADLLRQLGRPVPPEAETPAPVADEQAPASAGGGDDLDLIDIPETALPEADEGSPAGGAEAEPEVVEAKEIVSPSVRVVPASDEDEAAKNRLLDDPSLDVPAPEPASAESVPTPEPAEGEKDPPEWENELAQLNLKEEEKGLLGDEPASPETSADPSGETDADADLMSLLDEEFAGSKGAIVTGNDIEPDNLEAIPLAPPDESQDEPVADGGGPPSAYDIPAAPPMSETAPSPPDAPLEQPVEEMSAEQVEQAGPEPELEPGQEPEPEPARRAPVAPMRSESRSSVPKYFALLGVVILLAAGTAWWFLFRPAPASAEGNPDGPTAPPAGSSQAPPAGADAGPLPTPIGGPSKKPVEPSVKEESAAAIFPLVEVVAEPAPEIDQQAMVTLSPQEVERRIAGHMRRGRKLFAQKEWKAVKHEMRAAMALDPFNLQVRQLADRADAEISKQEALLSEFAEVRRMFEGKDYQGALWKLYRMPRDPAFGDFDRYIRNSWYNWAALSMKAGNNKEALEKIGEALSVDPRDSEALKMQGFVELYAARAKDNVYYAFADGLELRSINQK